MKNIKKFNDYIKESYDTMREDPQDLPEGIFDVEYKGKTYYVKPEEGDQKVWAFDSLESLESGTPAKQGGGTLMLSIKDLFGMDKWIIPEEVQEKVSDEAREYISKKISKLRDEGYPQDQAVAMAYSYAKRKGFHSVPEAPEK